MKNLIAATALLFTVVTATAEEVRFVSDELRITMRKIPDGSGAILHYGIPAGTRLILLEQNDEGWSKVTTPANREGWVRTQYLMKDQVAKVRIQYVESELKNLQAEHQALKEQMSEATNGESALRTQLETAEAELAKITQDYNDLKKISENTIALNKQNIELSEMNANLRSESTQAIALADSLRSEQSYKWFGYGALAVLLGAVLALGIPRLRPKRRYSEWG